MRTDSLAKALTEIGLSQKEADVYLALLSLGSAKVVEIAKISDLKRTSVYPVLESLERRGLVSTGVKGFKTVYQAANPQKLESLLETRRAVFQRYLPELRSLYRIRGQTTHIRCFDGMPSVKTAYEDLVSRLRLSDNYCAIADEEQWFSLDNSFFRDYIQRRSESGCKVRLLLQRNAIGRKSFEERQTKKTTIKLLPGHVKLNTSCSITSWCVLIHQLAQPTHVMVVENPSIVEMHRSYFDIMWNAIE